MYLYGTTVPQPGKTYAIHPYSLQDGPSGKGANIAVTVDGTRVSMFHWEGASTQKWECVEKNGWLGFICRASSGGSNGGYLGYDSSETLVCTAQYQDKWEDFQANLHNEGIELEMRKDDHLAYVGIVGQTLKMLADRVTWWGFTEWV